MHPRPTSLETFTLGRRAGAVKKLPVVDGSQGEIGLFLVAARRAGKAGRAAGPRRPCRHMSTADKTRAEAGLLRT